MRPAGSNALRQQWPGKFSDPARSGLFDAGGVVGAPGYVDVMAA